MSTPAHENLFIDSWNIYHKIVMANHMFHREIYNTVGELLDQQETAPFTFLDLGCGDASRIAPILQYRLVEHYTGVDLSDTALSEAARHLAQLTCPIQLNNAEMLGFLRQDSAQYDVIFTSYALHHLGTNDKQAFLEASHQHLDPEGSLILIDITRNEDQGVSEFLKAYCETIHQQWDALSPEEAQYVASHVEANDLPENISGLNALALTAGFRRFRVVARYGCHTLMHLTA